jgi:hypothetical protein
VRTTVCTTNTSRSIPRPKCRASLAGVTLCRSFDSDLARLAVVALEPPLESCRPASFGIAVLGSYTIETTVVPPALGVDEWWYLRDGKVYEVHNVRLVLATRLSCPHVLSKRFGL